MIAEKNTSVFDENTLEYDQWFEKHSQVYQSELLAVKKATPINKLGIEIGVGTGRFSVPLGIKFGVEPSENMARVSEQKGMTVLKAFAENLPIADRSFDFALMVTTVCFLADIPKAFSEVYRILKPKGKIIIGLIDKNSPLGKKYEKEKITNKFYKDAHFHSPRGITTLLQKAGFGSFYYWQTLVKTNQIKTEKPIAGFGKGSFVVIKATKNQIS